MQTYSMLHLQIDFLQISHMPLLFLTHHRARPATSSWTHDFKIASDSLIRASPHDHESRSPCWGSVE